MMKFLIQCAYGLALFSAVAKSWFRREATNIALFLMMLGVVSAAGYGALQMRETGKEHEVDAQWLESQYLGEKRKFARNCLQEGRGFAPKGEQMNPEVIEACENMATAMYPDKDFSKVAMLNWERQQLGVVIYAEDPMK
ncbi:hypothetical protein D3C85_548670 [compost metagenome]